MNGLSLGPESQGGPGQRSYIPPHMRTRPGGPPTAVVNGGPPPAPMNAGPLPGAPAGPPPGAPVNGITNSAWAK